jgi:hypothetical protein
MALSGQAAASDVPSHEKRSIFERTLEEPWRFRVTPFGWAPSEVDFHVKDGQTDEHASLSLDDLASALKGAAEVRGEVRKGPFGAFVSMMAMELNADVGNRISIDVDDTVFLWDYGLTYEVGRWNLGDTPESPAVTVEPFAGGRTLRDSIRINVLGRTTNVELDFTTPVVGLKTFWDLDKNWNFILVGDYGGFDVDDVHETWQITAVVGYRFEMFGLPTNFMAGYRKLFIDYRKNGAELEIDVHGPIVGLAIDF